MKKIAILAAITCAVIAPGAQAALSLVNYDGFVVAQSGNTWNFHHESPENTALKGGTVYGRDAASVSTSQPLTVSTKGTVTVGKGAVVDVVAKVPKANMAKGLIAAAKLAGRVGGSVAGGVVGGLAVNALIDYGLKHIEIGSDGSLQAEAESQNDYPVFNGYEYGSDNAGWALDLVSGCSLEIHKLYSYTIGSITPSGVASCSFQFKRSASASWETSSVNVSRKASNKCTVGWYVDQGICTEAKPLTKMSEQEILDWIAARDGWPTSAALALAGMLQYPDTRKILTPYPDNGVEINGPSSVPGKTITATESVQLLPGTNTVAPPGTANTQPGTRTTTTTATHPLTYSGNQVTYKTVNNTTNNITNNVTNITTSETKTEEIQDDDKEQTPSDTALGEVPKLYEKKYPDGLEGVWNQRSQEFRSSGLFSLAEQLMPTSLNGGTCPSFNLDLSIGPWADYGTHEVPMPCWIWDTCKYILLLMAAVSARRIVFGG